jgi:hypothetical protein
VSESNHSAEDDAPARPSRIALESEEALERLRDEAFRANGFTGGAGVLYGIGYIEGMVDGMLLALSFDAGTPGPFTPGPGLPLLFEPEPCGDPGAILGVLAESTEARLHLGTQGHAPTPACVTSAGYAAGWHSGLLGKTVLVRETQCVAAGDAKCRFEARSREEWTQLDDDFIREILPFLDFDSIERRARELVDAPEEMLVEGDMLGSFDAMSPAAHVWGPVAVLPYSGADDGEEAIESISADLGPGCVRVAIIDATGARIDSLEAAGLARLLDRLDLHGIEPILVGVKGPAAELFTPGRDLSLPTATGDLSEAIALAFQLCR